MDSFKIKNNKILLHITVVLQYLTKTHSKKHPVLTRIIHNGKIFTKQLPLLHGLHSNTFYYILFHPYKKPVMTLYPDFMNHLPRFFKTS